VQDVEDAIRRQNAEIPAGRIESTAREFTVVAETDLQTAEQFSNIIVANVGGYPVRIRDIGSASIGAVDERTISRFNGKPSLNVGVVKQAVANPLDLSRAVVDEVAKINATLPPGMKLVIGYDTSVFIDRSIASVFETIGLAILLVVLVIYFFLRNLRATLIPMVTIPVSLIGAFSLMYVFGFTVNTLTLLAMVLAIGLVVDDAIVMLENIFRHVETGMPPREAAIVGAREIGFAIVAMTLTLASVYAPLAFATGRIGRLFIEFALALAGSGTGVGFVASPLADVCSLLLHHGLFVDLQSYRGWIEALTRGHRRAKARLAPSLAHRRRWAPLQPSARSSSCCSNRNWRRWRIAVSSSPSCPRRRAPRRSTRRINSNRSRAITRRCRRLLPMGRSPVFLPSSTPSRSCASSPGRSARADNSRSPRSCDRN
jgi:multidrug efflux pump